MNTGINKRNGFEKGLLVLITAMSFWLGSVTSGLAAPMLTFSGGQLTGATGVVVGGTPYDVTLMDGTCVALFDGCDALSDFPFPTLAAALPALIELETLINSMGFVYDPVPSNVFGCSTGSICILQTPAILVPVDNFNAASVLLFSSGSTNVSTTSGPIAFDFTGDGTVVLAIWQPIPEPTTMMLLSTGLLGLVAYRWRQGRTERLQVG